MTQMRRSPALVQADPACHSASQDADAAGTRIGMTAAGTAVTSGRGRKATKAAAVGVGTLSTEALFSLTHPWIGEILTIAQIMIPLIGALVLLIIILWGSDERCDRVFRLLRWATNRPEPAEPIRTCPGPKQASKQ